MSHDFNPFDDLFEGLAFDTQSEINDSNQSISKLDKRLKHYAPAHKRALQMSNYIQNYVEDTYLRKDKVLAHRLSNCGSYLLFKNYYTVDRVKLAEASFCMKHLLCPLCAIRRGAKYIKAYLVKVNEVLKDKPDLKAYLVTLTVKNHEDLLVCYNNLRDAMRDMSRARRDYFGSISRKGRFRPHVEYCKAEGGVSSIEAIRGRNFGLYHPHSHQVWLCYEEPDHYKLSDEWRKFSGGSFIVDVTPFHDQRNISSGFCEVFKYALKSSSMSLEDNYQVFKLLSGKRLVDSFGCLRGVEVPEDLTDKLLDDLPCIEMLFKYFSDGYRQIDGGNDADTGI